MSDEKNNSDNFNTHGSHTSAGGGGNSNGSWWQNPSESQASQDGQSSYGHHESQWLQNGYSSYSSNAGEGNQYGSTSDRSQWSQAGQWGDEHPTETLGVHNPDGSSASPEGNEGAVGVKNKPDHKTKKRFSTPAVAALVLAAAVASGAVTGIAVSDHNSNDSQNSNQSALQALNTEPAKTTTSSSSGTSVQTVAQKVLPSVVSITVESGNSGDTGSGSILSADGTIITNNHVIESAANGGKITVTLNDGRTFNASIVARDPETDIAVIKAEGASNLTPITIGDSSSLAVGQEVVAVGSPLGLDATVTSGIVSAMNRPVQVSSETSNQSTLIDAIQTDAAINPGNSGGALVDMNGNLIGIPSVIASLGAGSSSSSQSGSIGLGFAIPINQAKEIAEQLIKNGKADHPAIGVTIKTDSTASGAVIAEVPSGSAAAQAGLKAGDVVTKVDDRRIDSGIALIAAIRSHQVGDTVKLQVTDSNGGNAHDVELKLQSQETVQR